MRTAMYHSDLRVVTLACTGLCLIGARRVRYQTFTMTVGSVGVHANLDSGASVHGALPRDLVSSLPGYGVVDEIQYAGFVNVEKASDSSLFYWMFERIGQVGTVAESPLVIWLQGGPGSSSLYGLFAEVGPYTVDDDLQLHRNEFSWHKHAHLMFVDFPVGTGFSYTHDEERYVRDDEQGAEDFLVFLNVFYEQHPEYRSCPLFLTGESYAGKYCPAIGHRILRFNQNCPKAKRISMSGLAVCGAWTHPEAQIPTYTRHAHQHGLLDDHAKVKADETMAQVMSLLKEGRMLDSTNLWDKAAEFIYERGNSFSPYDVRDFSGTADDAQSFDRWLTQPDVRRALHVGDKVYNEDDGVTVFLALRANDMVSSLDYLPDLLRNTRVLLFNGQYDWICNHAGVEGMLERDLEWNGRDEFLMAHKETWWVDDKVAGYVRNAQTLTHVLVLGAGHMVPADTPMLAFELIGKFLNDETIT